MSLISKLKDFHNDQLVKKFIDLRLIDDQSLRLEILNILISLLRADLNSEEFTLLGMQIIQSFPYPITRGFYDVNKTDVLFPKLKSHHNEHESYHLVGEVLDSIKGEGLIVRILEGQELKLGDQLYLQSPQGNNGIVTLTKLHDLLGHSKVIAHANDLVKMNFMKHFPSQSTVFKIHENLIP